MSVNDDIAALDANAKDAFDRWYHAADGTPEAHEAWDAYQRYSNRARKLVNAPTTTEETMSSTAWPKNVIARYLTVGGATVDISFDANGDAYLVYIPTCLGCEHRNRHRSEYPSGYNAGMVNEQTLTRARAWAQAHAEKCRAMPRPA